MPFNLQLPELIVIMAIALIVFGPKKLPEIGKSLGGALRQFNKARNDFMESINSEVDRDEPEHTVAASTAVADTGSAALPAPAGRRLEYPEPLDTDDADALPYGSAFQAEEGDSQPSFRTTQPEGDPVTFASAEPRLAAQGAGEGKD